MSPGTSLRAKTNSGWSQSRMCRRSPERWTHLYKTVICFAYIPDDAFNTVVILFHAFFAVRIIFHWSWCFQYFIILFLTHKIFHCHLILTMSILTESICAYWGQTKSWNFVAKLTPYFLIGAKYIVVVVVTEVVSVVVATFMLFKSPIWIKLLVTHFTDKCLDLIVRF